MTPRLQLTDIKKSFGATRALDGVEMNVGVGEVHAIIGENGAGKSTLMKILSGAHRPDAGKIQIDGNVVELANPRAAQAAGIAMIYQELNLAPELSVCQNILLGHEIRASGSPLRSFAGRLGWIDQSTERQWAIEALTKLNSQHLPLDRPAGELSIAEQQMVEIARAIVTSQHSPGQALRLLILDEPTSSLTQLDTERLFAVIEQLAAGGVSVIYISHFLEECQRIADRFTVLRDGRSVYSGRMPNRTQDSRTCERNAVIGKDEPESSMSEIIHSMVGRELSSLYPRFTHQRGDVVLSVKALGVNTLNGKSLGSESGSPTITFDVHRGEIFGLAGLIGAGRTETLRAIFGLDPATGGEVCINSEKATTRRADLSWSRDQMGLVSEDRKNEGLFLTRSLTDNLTITQVNTYLHGGLLSSRAMSADTATWMQKLDVKAHSPEQLIGTLSGGNQQKIALARLLHHDCEILLLDEPTRGIDIGSKSMIYEQIGKLAVAGKAIVLVSSYLPELLGLCDRIGVFSRGRLVEVRQAQQWSEHTLLEAAIGQN
jgi:ribose transport system ATP-binding protein